VLLYSRGLMAEADAMNMLDGIVRIASDSTRCSTASSRTHQGGNGPPKMARRTIWAKPVDDAIASCRFQEAMV
jgi:hypothetical protein